MSLVKAEGWWSHLKSLRAKLTSSPSGASIPHQEPHCQHVSIQRKAYLSLLRYSVFLISKPVPYCHQTFPPFPWRLNRLWYGAHQKLLKSVNRVCLLFPSLSIHLFGPSKSSSRLGRHDFSSPKSGCLSTGGGVRSSAL